MALNPDAIGKKIGPVTSEYTWKDLVLYALGVGAGFDELEYVYEARLKAIPSFGAAVAFPLFAEAVGLAGINLAGLLHAEHDLILHSPIPPQGDTLTTEGRIAAMYDRGEGKGALVIVEATTHGSDGRKLFTNVATLFARLDGGFGGDPPPKEIFAFPEREPDFEEAQHPSPDQPLVYRLSGDTFALHVDPDFARASGFDGPIMHGLCTHGFACRAIIRHLFPGEPERMARFRVRFSRPLYPGQPIQTRIWKLEEGKALFRTVNLETGEVVLDRGIVEWVSREEAERRAQYGIRFDGRVAVVTGAGRGLGRTYALELAKRGAKVVVNDPGVAPDGSGGEKQVADAVVEEIRALGGEAVPNYDSVATPQGGQSIIQTALDTFGHLDILIHNAGILRDKTFAKMSQEMWKNVLAVHLEGAFNVTQPAFRLMKKQGYGRIVFTTSAASLFGNFGQSNYAAAKMGLVGLMNALKLEGAKYNIKVNTVAPIAATRLTQDILPPNLHDRLRPEFVAPLVLYLCSEQCPVNGRIYQAGGGVYGRAAVVSGPGVHLGEGEPPTPEEIAAHWQEILSLDGAREYPDANAALMAMLTAEQGTGEQAEQESEEAGKQRGAVRAVFERLPDRFQADKAAGVDAVFQFSISGPDGGNWFVVVKNQTCTVQEGTHPTPTTTLKMTDADFLALLEGKLPAMQAFTTGKLKIEGNLMKSQWVQKLFGL